MSLVRIEIVGGPADGATIVIGECACHDVDGRSRVTQMAGVPVHRRDDGRLYIRWGDIDDAVMQVARQVAVAAMMRDVADRINRARGAL